ncbi:hypothetical protein K470DRAFT_261028 [Piedraia hortae CBS 480.64]|uniref:NADH dehydrogenase [ubiquinone] 1 alpha subcomplex assembly factor 3 n=1 Tax=Piedraia hortae CBS 480.64 TaxID=1314780 RepID=A0A6A7BPE7_9PEZI|nr:hypothetical protein K470DRAFT_261028 [Piedraia hortae CBS 480.64]
MALIHRILHVPYLRSSVLGRLPALASQTSQFHAHQIRLSHSPRPRGRGPPSMETTQTDFGAMDIYSDVPPPAMAVDSCTNNGFVLENGIRVADAGILLVGGEAFAWHPHTGNEKGGTVESRSLVNDKGQFHLENRSWGVFELIWPRPDLLILGTGHSLAPVSTALRQHINGLGIKLDVQDTRNAAAQFNMLATERGPQEVAAALVPIGWGKGR